MRKKKLQENLLSKKIILTGYQKECEEIYYVFHEILDIVGYLMFPTDEDLPFENEQQFQNQKHFCHLEKYHISQIDTSEHYIILCNGYTGVCWGYENIGFDKHLFLNSIEYEENYIDAFLIYSLPIFRNRLHDWKNQEILIFGCGKFGRSFYQRFKNQYNIVGFISNNETEIECMGLPVHRVDESINNKKIVICSVYRVEMIEQLLGMGKNPYEEFATNKMLLGKNMLSIGTCHVNQNAELLKHHEMFTVEYSLIQFLYSIRDRSVEFFLLDKVMRLLHYSDVVFCLDSLPGLGEYPKYVDYIKQQNIPCKLIRIPPYIFAGLHPQLISENGFTHNMDYTQICKLICLFYVGDYNVKKLFDQGESEDEIVNTILGDSYYDKDYIVNNFNEAIGMLDIFDTVSDIKISKFVRENYRKKLLFRDSVHFSTFLILEMSSQILKILDIPDEFSVSEKKCLEKNIDFGSVVMIYPCVARTLKIEIDELKCGYKILDHNLQVSIINEEEYIRKYYKYLESRKTLLEEGII